MMYSLPFYPHFPPRRYSYYPHPVNTNTVSPSDMRKANNSNNSHSNMRMTTNPSNSSSIMRKANNHHDSPPKMRQTNNKKTDEPTETNVSSEKDDTIFEIFGIKLHSDDILLICLIFFLFKEGVQDEYLFISLILLLLS